MSSSHYSVQDPAQPQSGTGGLSADQAPTRQDGYDKLVSDKPGEELAPDSAIWKLYAEEAKEYDNDLVADHNKNLDTMLLFAGLFSAILTAFLIESTSMLAPNLEETSTALLLSLAQSQWRTETGNQNKSLPPVEIPSFKPSASARWINTIWFMALALSLGAAMMAMLAKEWLSAFLASPPRHPYEYALKRQARIDALVSWNALRIVDFLPTLLHFSLLLFTLGLIIQLWLLDRVIAYIMVAASAALTLSYLSIVILGAAKENCPYRTRMSRYIAKLFRRYKLSGLGGRKTSTDDVAHSRVTANDFRALQWLATHARDPAVGDNAYQALAGLKSRKLRQWELDSGSKETALAQFNETTQEAMEDYSAVVTMGSEIVKRLSNSLIKYPRELAFCRGTNAARYAGALPELYQYACECLRKFQQNHNDNKPSRDWFELWAKANVFKRHAFQALDTIWDNECPPFTADSYACLTAAELRLTGSALDEIEVSKSVLLTQTGRITLSPHTSISFPPDSPNVQGKASITTLFELRARYSRALCRAAFQLLFHSNGRAPIGNFALINLLDAIGELAHKEQLDLQGELSTHHPQDEKGVPMPFVAFITGTSGYRMLDPLDIGDADGMLGGLTTLLGSASVKALPKLEVAALNAMEAIGPKLIKEWIQMERNASRAENGAERPEYMPSYGEPPVHWQPLSVFGDPKIMLAEHTVNMPRTKCVISYLLEVTSFAISYFNHPGIRELPDIALESLYNRASAPPSARHAAHEVICPKIEILMILIDSIGRLETDNQRGRLWSQDAKTYLLRLLAIRSQRNETIFDHLLRNMKEDNGVENTRLFTVLEIMSTAPGYPDEVKRLLENVTSCVHDEYDGYFSKCFTDKSDGFHCLQKIGSHPNYTEYVSQTIISIINYLAENPREGEEWIQVNALPGFLDAVSFVCRNPPPEWSKSSNLLIPAVISTLQRLDVRSITPYLSIQSALDDLKVASKHMSNQVSKARFLSAQTAMEAEVKRLSKAVEELGQGLRQHHQRLKAPSPTPGDNDVQLEGHSRHQTL